MTRRSNLRDLVGDHGSPEEQERLRRVHDLLIAAGPPPTLASDRIPPRRAGIVPRVQFLADRTSQAALLLAAAVLVFGIGVGYAIRGGSSFATIRTVSMHGVVTSNDLTASIQVGKPDQYGNWPLLLAVHGLKKLPNGGWYTLYLTKAGKPVASCGTFNADEENLSLRLNAPYDLKRYTGWVVAIHHPNSNGPQPTVLTT